MNAIDVRIGGTAWSTVYFDGSTTYTETHAAALNALGAPIDPAFEARKAAFTAPTAPPP